jgi:SAM-dependent methyltransferase
MTASTDPVPDDRQHGDRTGIESNAAIWRSDEHIAQWVATAEDRERHRHLHRLLLAALLPFGDDQPFTFVDLGAGTGAASRAVLAHFPRAEAVLADFSPQMMVEARSSMAPFEGRYRTVSFDLAAGVWPDELAGPFDCAISSLCVHHLPDDRKRDLFSEIFERLTPGGWFLDYDPVAAPDPDVEAAWQRAGDRLDPEAAAARTHRTPEQQQRWENHVRHISPLGSHLVWLREAGFRAVDVYMKQLDHVIIGGMRPASGGAPTR